MKRPDKVKDILDLVSTAVGAGRLTYSAHANDRMKLREIIEPEVEYVLTNGHHEAKKDQFNDAFRSWDYAIRGQTPDGRRLRIVVALEQPSVVVVTAIDLDRED